ncbi:hypothetical protein IBZ16_13850 [Serratia marcescens]|uniref:hypothetical protein n=1 Tax=Serratia marcescens TaxID=615 RepID=UPI0039B47449
MNVKLTEIKNNGTPWLKIPADGSPLTFTGNADEAAKDFFNALIRVRDGYISALKAERDAMAVERDAARNALASIYKTVTGELPEWSNWHAYLDDIVEEVGAAIAANQTIDALAVENQALKESLESICNAYNEELTDLLDIAVKMAVKLQTQATDAALAAIQARAKVEAIELLIGRKKRELADMHPDTHAFGMTSALIRNHIRCLESFATELREAK